MAVDATPLLGTRTGVGRFCEGAWSALAARPELDVAAFAVTWRRRHRLAPLVPAGVARPPAGHARPPAAPGVGRSCRSRPSNGSWGRPTSCTAPTSSSRPTPPGRPGRHGPRPHHGALPRALRSGHARLPAHGPPGRGRGRLGAHAVALRGRRGGGRPLGADPDAGAASCTTRAPGRRPGSGPAAGRGRHGRPTAAAGDVALRPGRGRRSSPARTIPAWCAPSSAWRDAHPTSPS